MNECIFCKIIKGDIPADKVYEDENHLAFLDINPINPGHTLLIPKEHHKDIYALPDNILSGIAPVAKKIAIAVKQAVDAEGINIGMNNEKAAGQLVPHAHLHIIPRFSNDGHLHWPGKPYTENEAQATAEKIKNIL